MIVYSYPKHSTRLNWLPSWHQHQEPLLHHCQQKFTHNTSSVRKKKKLFLQLIKFTSRLYLDFSNVFYKKCISRSFKIFGENQFAIKHHWDIFSFLSKTVISDKEAQIQLTLQVACPITRHLIGEVELNPGPVDNKGKKIIKDSRKGVR